jgi:CHAT domain-containing protein/tetratricopeptide (TPR) repeat protein
VFVSTLAYAGVQDPPADRQEAERLMRLAADLTVRRTQPEQRQALAHLQSALGIWQRLQDQASAADTLNRMGRLEDALGNREVAEDHFTEAARISEQAGNTRVQAAALAGMGKLRLARGDSAGAIDLYRKALPLRRAQGDKFEEALLLHNLGAAHWGIGENREALEAYESALLLRRELKDEPGIAYTLYGIAVVHWTWGDNQKSLETYEEVRHLWRKLKNKAGEAHALSSMGLAYQALGAYGKALSTFDSALPLWRETKDRSGEGYTLNNIGLTHAARRDWSTAQRFYTSALDLLKEAPDPRGQAYVLHNLGDVLQARGLFEEALKYYGESLERKRRIRDRFGEAITLERSGEAWRARKDPGAALELLRQALELHRLLGNATGEASTLAGMARAYRDRAQLAEANDAIESALTIVERNRARISARDLRTAFFTTRRDLYAFHVELLMQLHRQDRKHGWNVRAFEAAERGRARVLLDTLSELRAGAGRGNPPVTEREQQLRQAINAQAQLLQRLAGAEAQESRSQAVKQRLDDLLRSWEEGQASAREADPRRAAVVDPSPLGLAEIQADLPDANTALLSFHLGGERSYVWCVTRSGATSAELPGRATIDRLVRRLYDAVAARGEEDAGESLVDYRLRLQESDAEWTLTSGELGRMLLTLLPPDKTISRLVIVPDGALWYVPFAALPSGRGGEPLVMRFEIACLPSASMGRFLVRQPSRQKGNTPRLAVLADPVFGTDDERILRTQARTEVFAASMHRTSDASSDPSFPRLRFSRVEADGIAALVPANRITSFVDFAASRNAFEARGLRDAEILHLATHAVLDTERPELSGIVLSSIDRNGRPQDGFLRLYEIYNLDLNAGLVVLSACRTALGRQIEGEGIVGLSRGFFYAGASNVLASLWSVQDRATAELMRRFYQALLEGRADPAAALRSAQLALRSDPRWSHPYYWAAFTVQGSRSR